MANIRSSSEAQARGRGSEQELLVSAVQARIQFPTTQRRVFNESHRSFIPNFGCYIKTETDGKFKFYAVTTDGVVCR